MEQQLPFWQTGAKTLPVIFDNKYHVSGHHFQIMFLFPDEAEENVKRNPSHLFSACKKLMQAVNSSESFFVVQLFTICIVLLVAIISTFYRAIGYFFKSNNSLVQDTEVYVGLCYAGLAVDTSILLTLLTGINSCILVRSGQCLAVGHTAAYKL